MLLGGRMLVAIVDDDADLCSDVGRWVAAFAKQNPNLGTVHFEAFSDGEALVELLRKSPQPKALVLLDLDIRGDKAAGISTLQKMKTSRASALRNVPVVIYSNTKDPSEVVACYRQFANSYVWKGPGAKQKQRFLDLMKFWVDTATVPQAM